MILVIMTVELISKILTIYLFIIIIWIIIVFIIKSCYKQLKAVFFFFFVHHNINILCYSVSIIKQHIIT